MRGALCEVGGEMYKVEGGVSGLGARDVRGRMWEEEGGTWALQVRWQDASGLGHARCAGDATTTGEFDAMDSYRLKSTLMFA